MKNDERAETISSKLCRCSSVERSWNLLMCLYEEPPAGRWKVLIENWNICDGLYPYRRYYLDIMRQAKSELSPIPYMEPADRAFYEGLPPRVTVFRGCGRRRARSLSWTTDYDRAAFFARGGRWPTPPDPVIACAEVAKEHIFFVCTSRNEQEIVLDPARIGRLRLSDLVDT